MKKNTDPISTSYVDIMEKNHMEIPWHDYTGDDSNVLISDAGLIEKASVIGRVGLILLSCGTGAWRVRTSMNKLSKELGVTCTVDVGLMSIEFNCFDGNDCVSQSLSIANTGVNTSKLYRMERFVDSFPNIEAHLTGEEIHKRLDEIERIHALYSPVKLGLAAALACCAFTFLLGGGPVEMILAFIAAGVGNIIRTKLIKHHFTLFLNIAASISAACLIYTICLKLAEMLFHVAAVNEAGYICSILFIIPGFPFITSGIDLAKLDLRSGLERLTYSIIIVLVATMSAWIMALLLHLQPLSFADMHINVWVHFILRKYRRLHMIDFLVRILWPRTFGTFCVLRFCVLCIFHNSTLNHKRLRQRDHNKHTYDCCKNKQNLPEHDCTHNRTDSSDSEQQ